MLCEPVDLRNYFAFKYFKDNFSLEHFKMLDKNFNFNNWESLVFNLLIATNKID